MKKIAAAILAALLFFNWYGYRLLAEYLQYKNDQRLEVRLDRNDYDESQLVEVRVPLNLPYQNDWTSYERFDGEIDFHGIHYKYVKRKVEKGYLILKCLPNSTAQQIRSARDEFFKLVNDLQQIPSGKKNNAGNSFSFKSFLSDYRQEKNNWSIIAFQTDLPDYRSHGSAYSCSGYLSTPDRPPRA